MEDRSESSAHRHYGTIGIEDVFLELPASPHLFPQFYLRHKKGDFAPPFESCEIVGTLKESPEDFCVREIAKEGRIVPLLESDEERIAFQVADIVPTSVCRENDKPVGSKEEKCTNPSDVDDRSEGNRAQDDVAGSEKPATCPLELVEAVLVKIFEQHHNGDVAALMESLRLLEEKALQRFASFSGAHSEEAIFIPSIPMEFSDRREFHQALRLAFPLLKSETLQERMNQIRISVDEFLDDLVPFLYRPEEDLPKLFHFNKRGYVDKPKRSQDHHLQGRGYKRKRETTTTNFEQCDDDDDPILRLKPDLSKDDRRSIHHLIAPKNRSFLTQTISNYPLDVGDKGSTTSAIRVLWSLNAKRRAHKKIAQNVGRAGSDNTGQPPILDVPVAHPNTICVLKKRDKEHLAAISAVCMTIKCPPSSVGLAGIKDMRAVTYQFCTLRNVSRIRILRAAPELKRKGVELGSIRKVDFFLKTGDLKGNRFEIVVRDLRRVHVDQSGQERFLPCTQEHAQRMFDRVRLAGFVNFFGEQRVGVPGDREVVGTRTHDIGRAMLQRDFSGAIDLLMSGRSVYHSCDSNLCEAKVRNAWKESGGDPGLTLKACPNGERMARQKTILKGLKRYGKKDPLAAIRCLPYNVRRFWINAYQSFVWNVAASARLMQLGKTPAIGDLFIAGLGGDEVQIIDEDNLHVVELDQIVLPLPGYGVKYPCNQIGDLYATLLTKDRINLEKTGPEEGTAKGAYRHLVARADNMMFSWVEERLGDDSTAVAMNLSFDLPAGSYATMMLRELMLTTVARD